jgi:hypothetical protein
MLIINYLNNIDFKSKTSLGEVFKLTFIWEIIFCFLKSLNLKANSLMRNFDRKS